MLCAIHGKQTTTKKMKADLDEMIVREAWWGTSGSWELLGSLYWKSHQKTRSASSHTNRNGRVLFSPQQMQNKACFAEHGTPVCWALRVAQLQNPNSHLINTVGLDHPFCVALQEWVQRPLGFTLLGFSRYGRELVGPYLATISRKLIILAFCWYTKKGYWSLHSWKKMAG